MNSRIPKEVPEDLDQQVLNNLKLKNNMNELGILKFCEIHLKNKAIEKIDKESPFFPNDRFSPMISSTLNKKKFLLSVESLGLSNGSSNKLFYLDDEDAEYLFNKYVEKAKDEETALKMRYSLLEQEVVKQRVNR